MKPIGLAYAAAASALSPMYASILPGTWKIQPLAKYNLKEQECFQYWTKFLPRYLSQCLTTGSRRPGIPP